MTKSNMRELISNLGVYASKNATKKQLEALLAESFKSVLNIDIPMGATKEQLRNLMYEGFGTAAVVSTDEGLSFMVTDKPTADYIVEFTISGYHRIRAESEEAARKWVEEDLGCSYSTDGFGYEGVSDWDIEDSYKVEDEESSKDDHRPTMTPLTSATA